MKFFKWLFGGGMAEELYLSLEELPSGMSRCPRCSTLHDIASTLVKMPKATGAKAALEEYLSKIGNEQIRLKCPKCGTTYETQTTAQPKQTQPTSQSGTAPPTGNSPRDVTEVRPMSKKMLALLKHLETYTADSLTGEAADVLRLFKRDFLPLGPEALEAIPHLFKKLSTLPGVGGRGNGLKSLCYNGFVEIPGSFGEQGHNVAVTSMVHEVLRTSSMLYYDLGVIVRAVCGSVKRGARGEGVLRSLEEFKSWIASKSSDQQFEAGSVEDFFQGEQRKWQTELAQAIQDIKATAAPAVSHLPESGHGKPTVSAPEKVHHPPSTRNRSAQVDAPAAAPSKCLDPLAKLSIVCECGHRGAVKAEYAGRTVKCPKCQRKIQVPG